MTWYDESHEIQHITQEYKYKYYFILHENEAYFMAIKSFT